MMERKNLREFIKNTLLVAMPEVEGRVYKNRAQFIFSELVGPNCICIHALEETLMPDKIGRIIHIAVEAVVRAKDVDDPLDDLLAKVEIVLLDEALVWPPWLSIEFNKLEYFFDEQGTLKTGAGRVTFEIKYSAF